jgi:hypothetical protein
MYVYIYICVCVFILQKHTIETSQRQTGFLEKKTGKLPKIIQSPKSKNKWLYHQICVHISAQWDEKKT